MYNYFVSFNWFTSIGAHGSGCTFLELKEKITSKTDLRALSKMIKSQFKDLEGCKIAIMNFILLDE